MSPKENRDVPPLKYHYVHRLKQERPDLEILLNGGVQTLEQIDTHLLHVDGVMLGREAYHNPYLMASWDARYYADASVPRTRSEVVEALLPYIEQMLLEGHKVRNIARHVLGLFQGVPGARRWRRMLSDARSLEGADASLLLRALEDTLRQAPVDISAQ